MGHKLNEIRHSHYCVIEIETSEVLFALQEHDSVNPASIIKALNAIVALDTINQNRAFLNDRIVVPANFSSAEFPAGCTMLLSDLLYYSILESLNVAAHLIAIHIGQCLARAMAQPSDPKNNVSLFIAEMQKRAWALGMEQTVVTTVDGREQGAGIGRRGQRSTPSDLVRLFAAVADYPQLLKMMSTDKIWVKNGLANDVELEHSSPNVSMYPGTVAEKGGQTSQCHTGGIFRSTNKTYAYFVGGLWAKPNAKEWRWEDARHIIENLD